MHIIIITIILCARVCGTWIPRMPLPEDFHINFLSNLHSNHLSPNFNDKVLLWVMFANVCKRMKFVKLFVWQTFACIRYGFHCHEISQAC